VKNKLKVLDLFSGLGGFSLGLERTGHFKTVAFCDNNKYSKLVIDKHWKGIKIYDDIKEITKEKFTTDGIEAPDIITGGVPCQPFSVAGKQKGTSDDRYLWPEMFRIIKAFKSKFVIVENVRGIVNIENGMVFETVCSDLESEGYEVQAFNIPAAGVGAPHRRERIWFIAVREDATNTESKRTWKDNGGIRQGSSRISGGQGTTAAEDVGNSKYNGSPTSEIGRGHEEINGGTEKRQNESFEFERTSRSEDNGNVSKENKNNVADTNNEGLRTCIGGSDNDHATESRSGGVDRTRSESDVERHNSTSTEIKGMDVADTDTRLGNGENEEIQSRGQTSDSSSARGRDENDANSNDKGLEGFREGSSEFGQINSTSESSDRGQTKVAQGWWSVEPNVGRVAHGVSGRVHRLKGLGNSIVPQIVEEIGKALIKAEQG